MWPAIVRDYIVRDHMASKAAALLSIAKPMAQG
jgi:hypothetical protein